MTSTAFLHLAVSVLASHITPDESAVRLLPFPTT